MVILLHAFFLSLLGLNMPISSWSWCFNFAQLYAASPRCSAPFLLLVVVETPGGSWILILLSGWPSLAPEYMDIENFFRKLLPGSSLNGLLVAISVVLRRWAAVGS